MGVEREIIVLSVCLNQLCVSGQEATELCCFDPDLEAGCLIARITFDDLALVLSRTCACWDLPRRMNGLHLPKVKMNALEGLNVFSDDFVAASQECLDLSLSD